MLYLRHVVSQRLTSTLSTAGLQSLPIRRYHGDPGPQTSAHRKSQRHRLREATLGSGVKSILDGESFRSILTADPIGSSQVLQNGPFQPPAEREPRRPRESVSLRRDGQMRRVRPARVFDQELGKWAFVGSGDQVDGSGDARKGGPRERFKPQDIKAYNESKGKSDAENTPWLGRTTPGYRGESSGQTQTPSPQRPAFEEVANGFDTRPPSARHLSVPPRSSSIGSSRNGSSTDIKRSRDDPFNTSALLRDHIKASPSPMSNHHIEGALRIVESAPKAAVNVVVWNQLLGLLGREGRMEKMWKCFNDMKKTGIRPSAHTYTSMLNSYAGLSHSSSPFTSSSQSVPPPNHLSRVTILWKQAQAHSASHSSDASGLESPDSPTSAADSVLSAPTNAYMKFLARYRMWDEMWGVYQDARMKGEVWDRVGYTTLFRGLLSLARRQIAEGREGGEKKGQVLVGPMAREVWDDAVRALDGKRADDGGLDNLLAGLGVGTLLMGRPEDQRVAMDLIPALWEVTPLPSTSSEHTAYPSVSDAVETISKLPTLQLDIKTATSLIHSLSAASRPTLASHYASLLLARPRVRREADPPFLYACATAFANTGDITAVLELLHRHGSRPPQGGWKMGFWYDCLSAARWARVEGEGAGKGDWKGMKSVLEWMDVIPKSAKPVTVGDEWKRKRAPTPSAPALELDVKAMVIILRTALGGNKANVAEAAQLLEKQGLGTKLQWFEQEMRRRLALRRDGGQPQTPEDKQWEWFRELSKDVRRAQEALGEKDALEYTSETTRAVVARLNRPSKEAGPERDEGTERGEGRSSREGEKWGRYGEGRTWEGARDRRGMDQAWKP